MKIRTFTIERPEQLKELSEYGYSEKPTMERIAKIWSAERRRKPGKCSWDGKIYICMSGDRTGRSAELWRITCENEILQVGCLQYNKTLKYCEQHRMMPFDLEALARALA